MQPTANTRYQRAVSEEGTKKAWDPWFAFLEWSPERVYGAAITLKKPLRRSTIEEVTVIAAPLFSITTLDATTQLIDQVGRP